MEGFTGEDDFMKKKRAAPRKNLLEHRLLAMLLVCVLAASVLTSVAGIVCAQKVISADSAQIMNLLCEEKANELDQKLSEVENVVDMDYSYITRRLENDENRWNDADYMADFVEHVREELDNTARNTTSTVAIYMRMNPDVVQVTNGVFLVRNSIGGFKEGKFTDLAAYDSDDTNHVGWYYEPIANGEATWLNPYYNSNIRAEVVSYVIPFYKNGSLLGVVGIDLALKDLRDEVNALSAYDTGYAFLVAANGDVIYHKDYPNGVSVEDYDGGLQNVRTLIQSKGEEGKILNYTWEGQSKRLVYRKLVNQMYLVLTVPSSEIDASRNTLILQCVSIFLIVALIAIFVGLQFIRRITRPLRELTDAAQRVADGDWEVEIHANSEDEVGILATTLHQSLEQLHDNVNRANRMADTDSLTGLYNRYYMSCFCRENMAAGQQGAGILYCDLNNLKYTNDRYGHAEGDRMIKEMAGMLRECFPEDMCCRMGGDEFIVCVFERSEEDFLSQVDVFRAKSCRDDVEGASIGYCWYQEVTDFDAMMTEAENRMYEDKRAFYRKHPDWHR